MPHGLRQIAAGQSNLNKSIITSERFSWSYVKMFRAQLSREELALLAFNMLLDAEGKKMENLAAKYGILKHLPKNRLRQEVEQQLNPLVFGRHFAQARHVTEAPQGATP